MKWSDNGQVLALGAMGLLTVVAGIRDQVGGSASRWPRIDTVRDEVLAALGAARLPRPDDIADASQAESGDEIATRLSWTGRGISLFIGTTGTIEVTDLPSSDNGWSDTQHVRTQSVNTAIATLRTLLR